MNQDTRVISFRLLFLCLILLPLPRLLAQQAAEFAPPFEPGDILVYDITPPPNSYLPPYFIVSTGPGGYAFQDKESLFNVWGTYPIASIGGPDYRHRFSVDTSGFVFHEAEWGKSRFQVYPAFIPQGDHIIMNGETWNIPRRLDTTVLGALTRGFEMERGGLRRIITERFGETAVLDRDGNAKMVLTSAVIRDTVFNRDTAWRNYLPLCVGNRYVYFRYVESAFQEEVETEVTETSEMDGRTWFHLEGRGPLIGWFRSDSTGVYQYLNGQSTMHIPGNAALGIRTRIGMIADTDTVTPWPEAGLSFFRVYDWIFDQDFTQSRYWLADFGIFEQYRWGYDAGSEEYDYIFGVICGEVIGRVVDVDPAHSSPESTSIDDIFPNPASNLATAAFTLPHATQAEFVLTDMLGRRVRQLGAAEYPAGSHRATVRLEGLRPGLYLLTLRTPSVTATRRVVVAQ